jgi:ribosomal-protein-serine acetyltransferase
MSPNFSPLNVGVRHHLRGVVLNVPIVLESLNEYHAVKLFELTEQNRSYLKVWLSWLDSVTKVEDTQNFIRSTIEQKALMNFVIIYNNSICGIAGFYKIEQSNGLLGYWLSEEFSGRGIMTEAIKQITELGFSKLKLSRIEIRCAEQNLRSRSIPERLGFRKESILMEAEWLYSKYVNHIVYSKSRCLSAIQAI